MQQNRGYQGQGHSEPNSSTSRGVCRDTSSRYVEIKMNDNENKCIRSSSPSSSSSFRLETETAKLSVSNGHSNITNNDSQDNINRHDVSEWGWWHVCLTHMRGSRSRMMRLQPWRGCRHLYEQSEAVHSATFVTPRSDLTRVRWLLKRGPKEPEVKEPFIVRLIQAQDVSG